MENENPESADEMAVNEAGVRMVDSEIEGLKADLADANEDFRIAFERWREAGGAFVDVQLPTEHLTRMGAVEIARDDFLARLEKVRDRHVPVLLDRLPVSRLA